MFKVTARTRKTGESFGYIVHDIDRDTGHRIQNLRVPTERTPAVEFQTSEDAEACRLRWAEIGYLDYLVFEVVEVFKHEVLAHFKCGHLLQVWFTFVPMDERQPYEVEVVRGIECRKTRHSIREEAATNFRGLVESALKSV